MKKLFSVLVVIGVLVAVFSVGSSHALGLTCISNNNATDCANGESQLSVDVYDSGNGGTTFQFHNAVGESMTVANIYFDSDSELLTQDDAVLTQYQVVYVEGGSPIDLPSGNTVNFESTFHWSAEDPKPSYGLNDDQDELYITFLSAVYEDVYDELLSGDTRIGLHVINFDFDGSESFTTLLTPDPVPEPSTWSLMGIGLIGLVAFRRKLGLGVESL